MSAQDNSVDIIIPNWNGLKWLPNCIDSIKKQSCFAWQICVVDNGSSDGSQEWLRETHPEIHLIALQENHGFSAAVNQGITATENSLIFLLNNDTKLAEDCVEQLMLAAAEQQDFAFFATKMLSYDRPDILDGAGDGFLRGGAGYRLGTMEKDSPTYNQAGSVFGACAGAALYRRTLFEDIGLFDKDFFAYLEDVDLNLRAARSGLRCWYIPKARVYHIGSASSGSKINPFTVKLSTRNSLNVLLKNYPWSFFFRFLIPIIVYQTAWLCFSIKKGCFPAWCAGCCEFLRQSRTTLAKRGQEKTIMRITNKELANLIRQTEKDVLASIMHRRADRGQGNQLFEFYSSVFLR